MKLKVEFVKNQKRWLDRGFCGPIALASMLRYYNDKSSVEQIAKKAGTLRNNAGTCPRGMAFYCLSKGFKVEYVNKNIAVKLNRKEYSERYRNFLKKVNEVKNDLKFRKRCERFPNYRHIMKKPTLRTIENYLSKQKPVVLYFNVGVVCRNDKLWPHYVTVVGLDNNNLYVHNIYPKNKKYQKISKKVFAKAWNSDGLDKSLIVAYR